MRGPRTGRGRGRFNPVVVALAGGLLLLAACGDGTGGEAVSAVGADQDVADPVDDEEIEADDPGTAAAFTSSDALEMFQGFEEVCAQHADSMGSDAIPSNYFSEATIDGEVEAGVWLVTDGVGNQLLIDANQGVVHSVDGPEAELPRAYLFGCPEDVFLGTIAEGGDDEPEAEPPAQEGGRDDPELESMRAFVEAFVIGDRATASQVASEDVLSQIDDLYGWSGQPAELVFVNADGSVAADYYSCVDCTYFFETGGDSWFIELDGDFIVGLQMGG